MTHEDWIAARKLGVSGTDVSIILGLNPYKKVDQLIQDKLGLSTPFVGNAATRAGQRLEAHVANAWSKREQKILINGAFSISEDNPRFIGTPDFYVGDGSLLEIKTGAEKTYLKGCPRYYEVQVAWYLMIKKIQVGTLVACIVPKDRTEIPQNEDELYDWVSQRPHREYQFERNPEFEAQMQEKALQFLERLDGLRAQQANQQG